MTIEVNENYANVIVRSLKDREEGLADDLQYYKGTDIGDAIDAELSAIRQVKDYIEERLLAE